MRMGLLNQAVEVKVSSVRLKVFFHLMKMMLEIKKFSQAGRKMENLVSIAKSYSHKLKARVSSQENEQPKEKEESNKERGHMGRGKRLCPVPCCTKVVVHLPRHLMQVHKWSHVRSRTAITNFNLRKKYTFKSKESAEAGNRGKRNSDDQETKTYKDYHKKRICPMMGCSACVK